MAVIYRRTFIVRNENPGASLLPWKRLIPRIPAFSGRSRFHGTWPPKVHSTCLCLVLLLSVLVSEALGGGYRKNPAGRYNPRGGGGGGASSHPDPVKRAAGAASDGAGTPCIYEGHLQTNRNWYGYLANISVRTTGQLGFEFAYPADRCCQNILFYAEDQLPLMGPRMNCWQREYLLQPEEDQILRLTPSFSWSGCHLATHDGVDMFVCKGGRSFSVDSVGGGGGRLTTWYIAASNCAILQGLDLLYRLEIYGHVGDCGGHTLPREQRRGSSTTVATVVARQPPVVKASLTPREAHVRQPSDSEEACVYEGSVNTTNSWYGFIRNLSLAGGGGFQFRFAYPYAMIVQNVILYTEDDIDDLNWEQSCWEKEAVISSEMMFNQILEMSSRATWNGCSVNDTAGSTGSGSGSGSGGGRMTCVGHRIFSAPQKVFMALSNCRSVSGLQLQYRLDVFGNADPCSGASGVLRAFAPHRILVAWTAAQIGCVPKYFAAASAAFVLLGLGGYSVVVLRVASTAAGVVT